MAKVAGLNRRPSVNVVEEDKLRESRLSPASVEFGDEINLLGAKIR